MIYLVELKYGASKVEPGSNKIEIPPKITAGDLPLFVKVEKIMRANGWVIGVKIQYMNEEHKKKEIKNNLFELVYGGETGRIYSAVMSYSENNKKDFEEILKNMLVSDDKRYINNVYSSLTIILSSIDKLLKSMATDNIENLEFICSQLISEGELDKKWQESLREKEVK